MPAAIAPPEGWQITSRKALGPKAGTMSLLRSRNPSAAGLRLHVGHDGFPLRVESILLGVGYWAVTMRIAEVIKLLAAPFPAQDAFLRDIPENTAASNFSACNDIYLMTVLMLESLTIQEGDAGTEGEESWRARTEIPAGISLPIEWLGTALRMLVEMRRPFLYTRHGLRSAHEWRLVRHLAGHVCDEMGWPREFRYPDFETLWNELGNGVLDEEVERLRWRLQEGETE